MVRLAQPHRLASANREGKSVTLGIVECLFLIYTSPQNNCRYVVVVQRASTTTEVVTTVP